jgi:hypothetical protein
MTDFLLIASATSFALSAGPAALFFANLFEYRQPKSANSANKIYEKISVLIPARDEESSIADCIRSALAGAEDSIEVVVLDDHSNDQTASIVRSIAQTDPRVRLESAPALPPGWCGKQHACWVLAGLARNPVLAFIDADVRFEPGGVRRAAGFLQQSHAALVSGVPRQETGTFAERLLIPLIHFVLLSYLPIAMMRRSKLPAFGAGCGQLFITRRDEYFQAGGHRAIKESLHDGISLPRAYRRADFSTDLFDATEIASCRMYRGAGNVFKGLAKNATEGMASPVAILPWTMLLFVGQVLPALILFAWAASGFPPRDRPAAILAAASLAAVYAVRFAAAIRFRQSLPGATLHPVGILGILAIQWYALLRYLRGAPSTWRGRTYAAHFSETA